MAVLATPLAMRPDSGSYLVMRFHLVTAWQRRLRSASVMPAQFRLGMGLGMRLGMGSPMRLGMGSPMRLGMRLGMRC